ncbi:MAG: amidohydrolase family protein [Gemmatimonadetes bacterium]|nr:amidohydrolase family protein [Gemmatimonadota bacterium]
MTRQLRALGVLAALAVLSSCEAQSRSPVTGATDAAGDYLEIIDAHTHTAFTGQPERTSGIVVSEEQYLKEMRDAGVVGMLAHAAEDGSGYVDLRAQNVITCAGTGARVDVARIEAGLKSAAFGCIKIYLGYVHQWAYSPEYEPVYALAAKYDVPVVFHTGDTYSNAAKLKYADPLTIDEVAVDHRNVTFVIAHAGNPWIESAAEVAYKNPNVYLDGSAFLVGDLSKMPPEQVETYVVKPVAWIFGFLEDPTKLMFATDWPLTHVKPYVEAFKRAIPPEQWKAVFHDNAARVFKFPAKTK